MLKNEKIIKAHTLYQGPIFNILHYDILTSQNKKAVRDIVQKNGGAAALVMNSHGHFLLVKQYRIAIDEITYEIPAGKLEENEEPLTCIKRELQEETGYACDNLTYLGNIYPTPGFCDEVIHLYLGTDLHYSPLTPDDDEEIEVVEVSTPMFLQMINDGTIKDAKTIIAFMYYLNKKTVSFTQ